MPAVGTVSSMARLKMESGQFGHVTTDEPSVSLIGSSNHETDLFRSSPDVPVPSGSNDNRVMCSGDCLKVKDELVDIDVHAGYSISVSGGSLKTEDETDSFKLYGCGICCLASSWASCQLSDYNTADICCSRCGAQSENPERSPGASIQ